MSTNGSRKLLPKKQEPRPQPQPLILAPRGKDIDALEAKSESTGKRQSGEREKIGNEKVRTSNEANPGIMADLSRHRFQTRTPDENQ